MICEGELESCVCGSLGISIGAIMEDISPRQCCVVGLDE